ncbi:hypothetical protein ONA23_02745 [Mycoplasmopsis cynos]|nr:hypothetical protein [Mycoplasmopsis cynos]WAM07059.1 hypothetical protein ONA23_02745 [Mycoplasmopsis cynos]
MFEKSLISRILFTYEKYKSPIKAKKGEIIKNVINIIVLESPVLNKK